MPTDRVGEGQAGPSVESLVKARTVGQGCVRKHPSYEKVMCNVCFASALDEALRAAEAALAEMTKERDGWRADYFQAQADAVHSAQIVDARHASELKASRAEATKAVKALGSALKIARPWIDGKATYEEWEAAVDTYFAAIRAPQPPEPVTLPDGCSQEEVTARLGTEPLRSLAITNPTEYGRRLALSMVPSSPPPPSEWKEPTKGSMMVGDLPYVLCPMCQKHLPRAGWVHTCILVPSPEPTSEEPSK